MVILQSQFPHLGGGQGMNCPLLVLWGLLKARSEENVGLGISNSCLTLEGLFYSLRPAPFPVQAF